MGAVTSVIVTLLLLLSFLDSPFHSGLGGVRPVAMERTMRVIDSVLPSIAPDVAPPCDAAGRPV